METNYYRVLGGTLTVSDQTYVRRRADEQLYKFLTTLVDQINRPCFILAPRQTGKSSLMNQSSFQLEQQGKVCARINLQRFGQSLTQDQFYLILLRETCKQINLVEWFNGAWQNNPVGIPITLAFQEVAEKLLAQLGNQRLILFLDEIQQLTYWNLQNSFLGLMKALATEEKLKNLTFVLLGVAKPSDLITDSAFALNVAYSIELGNLTLENCGPLLPGLEDVDQNPQAVLAVILKWTGGQPFLTQVVCALVANQLKLKKNANLEEEIKKLIEGKIIQDWRPNDLQSHFQEIENRFRRISPNNKQDKLKALSSYRDIWNGRRVQFQSESGAQMELLISGLVVKSDGDGLLTVANPIYQRIFNGDWIKSTQQLISGLETDRIQENLINLKTHINAWICNYESAILSNNPDEIKQIIDAVFYQVMQELVKKLNEQSPFPKEFNSVENCIDYLSNRLIENHIWEQSDQPIFETKTSESGNVWKVTVSQCSYQEECKWALGKTEFTENGQYRCQRLGFCVSHLKMSEGCLPQDQKGNLDYLMTTVMEPEKGCQGLIFTNVWDDQKSKMPREILLEQHPTHFPT